MIYLLLRILSSSIIFVVFKLFKRFEVNTMQAIIVNYFIACLVGFFGFIENEDLTEIPTKPWFFGTIILGILFIIVFNLAAATTQRSGLSVVSVATKMSVAIPVLFGILYFDEGTGFLKVLGIVLALIAVYLSSIKANTGIAIKKKNLIYPILVFLGSGIIDTLIKFIESGYVNIT
ncbi:MAG TPA: EamA family transporter, partial [Gillisia sp.]|nr:EamA family transporter [Gillisia sp.]